MSRLPCSTLYEVQHHSHQLYGEHDFSAQKHRSTLIHILALWALPGGKHKVMRITEQTPRSAHDRFALDLSRARADSIIITGQILRDEPHLQYSLPEGLLQWRRSVLRKHERPRLVVLSRGLPDPDHPALHGHFKPLIYSQRAAPSDYPFEVVHDPDASLGALVTHLHRVHKPSAWPVSISLEAGATLCAPLYLAPTSPNTPRVDELLLTRYHGDSLPKSVIGPEFPSFPALTRYFELSADETTLSSEDIHEKSFSEPSGLWTFSRLHLTSS